MILANEAVAAFLAGRRAESLYRVHEPPEPQSVAHLLAKLADLEVPTPPAPRTESMSPVRGGEGRGGGERAHRRLRREGRAWTRGLPGARPARA